LQHREKTPAGEWQGRDPRSMSEEELETLGHVKAPLLDVIRKNCTQCCCGALGEIRRCAMVSCAFWPYRMGTNPFRHREISEEERVNAGERMRRAREARWKKD